MGCVYKGLVFCRNNALDNGKHEQRTHSTKMGPDSLAEITPMPQNLSAHAQKFGISMKKGFIGRP